METKRCQRCHKLLRADASVCNRCGGRDFLQVTQARNRRTGATRESASIPSNPPASPHRAGHFSGLHPEDQPYQSSFLPVQRPPAPMQHVVEEDVEEISFSTVIDASLVPAPAAPITRRVASLSPSPQPPSQRSGSANGQTVRVPQVQQEDEEYQGPTHHASEPLALEIPTPVRKRGFRTPVVPILLILSCFLFLIATSILFFLLLASRPVKALKAELFADRTTSLRAGDMLELTGSGFQANALVNFTYDANLPVPDTNGAPLQVRTFSSGNFSTQLAIPDRWSVGTHMLYATDQDKNSASTSITIEQTPAKPPLLQLANTRIDLGADGIGVVSRKDFTLTNAGGSQVHWVSRSNATWLTLSPPGGMFAGSAVVSIIVDRSNLIARSYSGQITFTEQDGQKQSLDLTVTMSVNPASANLVLSNAAITFSGTTAQNPAGQSITIQNIGGQPLDWTTSITTANGGSWLAVSSTYGHLDPAGQATMTVSASSVGLGVGSYQGTLTFSYAGATATPVTVTLAVSQPPPPPVAKLVVTPNSLTYNAIQGQNPLPQSFTISNPGNAPLNWAINEDVNSAAVAPVSLSHGTLAPSKSIAITVTPMITQLIAGVANALITVVDTDTATSVKNQQVKVTFTIVNQAVISVDQNQLAFSHDSTITMSTQPLTITNTGSAPLNWALTISNTSPIPWLSVDNAGGTSLAPNASAFVNVACDSTHLAPGTYTATIQIKDTDAGSPVMPQTINVTLVVS